MGVVAALILLVSGCESETREVLVDVTTDYVPAREFVRVRTELFEQTPEGAAAHAYIAERAVTAHEDFIEGARVAEIGGLTRQTWQLRVRLDDGRGAPIAERVAVVELRGTSSAVTIVITRGCRGVICPPADQPELTACVGGSCVHPSCTPESPEACTEPSCANDAECASSVACARAVCREGTCLTAPDDALCAAGERCNVDVGCVPTTACGDGTCDASEDAVSCPADCGSGCPPFRVTRQPGGPPCSAATRDCVAACAGDLFCELGCGESDPNGACEGCGARNQWACVLERTDCESAFDCYAACADRLCLSPYETDCWLRACNPEFQVFGDCYDDATAAGCAPDRDACFP